MDEEVNTPTQLQLSGSRLFLSSRGTSSLTARRPDRILQPATIYASPRRTKISLAPRTRIPFRIQDDRATPELTLLMSSKVVQEYLLSSTRPKLRPIKAFPDVNRLVQRTDPHHCRSQLCQYDLQKRLRWLCAIRAHSLDNSAIGTNAVLKRRRQVGVVRPMSKKPDSCRGVFNDTEMKRKMKVMR